ncbi:unnamed protein product [Camellia sinensis]
MTQFLLNQIKSFDTHKQAKRSVEVKAGQPLKVNLEVGSVIHISQAALGEGKKGKGNDIVPLQVNINGKKLVLGSLSAGKFPQVSFDLVFEKEFELLFLTMAVFANIGGWIADTLVSKGLSVTTVRKIMQSIGFLGPAFFLTHLSHVKTPALAVLCMACSQIQ